MSFFCLCCISCTSPSSATLKRSFLFSLITEWHCDTLHSSFITQGHITFVKTPHDLYSSHQTGPVSHRCYSGTFEKHRRIKCSRLHDSIYSVILRYWIKCLILSDHTLLIHLFSFPPFYIYTLVQHILLRHNYELINIRLNSSVSTCQFYNLRSLHLFTNTHILLDFFNPVSLIQNTEKNTSHLIFAAQYS